MIVIEKTYLSSIIHITLIPQDHLLHVGTGVLLDVPDPVLDVVEGLLVGDVVNQHYSHCSSAQSRIIDRNQGIMRALTI